jgi:hypothetical protein
VFRFRRPPAILENSNPGKQHDFASRGVAPPGNLCKS